MSDESMMISTSTQFSLVSDPAPEEIVKTSLVMELIQTRHRLRKRHHTWPRSSRSKVRGAYETALSLTPIHLSSFAFPPKRNENTTALSGRLGHPADLNDLNVLPSLDQSQVAARPGPRSAVHLRLTEVFVVADIRGMWSLGRQNCVMDDSM